MFFEQIQNSLKLSEHLSEHELHERLKQELVNCKSKNTRGHVIEGARYLLQVQGNEVCPQAYAKLWGTSLSTLERISKTIVGGDVVPFSNTEHVRVDYPREDTQLQRFLNFFSSLRTLYGYEDHFGHIVLQFNARRDVYEAAVSGDFFNEHAINEETFLTYWSRYGKEYHIRLGSEKCAKCAHYDDESAAHPETAEINKEKKVIHRAQAEAQRKASADRIQEAQLHRNSVLSLCCDNAAKIHLPRRAIPVSKESGKTHIDLVMSNVHNDGAQKARYYVHSSQWSEMGNTIVGSIYQTLTDIYMPSHRRLYLHFDNHSTNRCNLLLVFLYHLVLLDWFDVVQVLFFIAYEAKSRADSDHSAMNRAIKHVDIYDPKDFVECLHRHGIFANWMTEIRDWEHYYEDYKQEFPNISAPHEFQITKEGVRSKLLSTDEEWSNWNFGETDHRQKEPFKVLKSVPPTTKTMRLKDARVLTEDELESCEYWAEHVIPAGRNAFFRSLSQHGNGIANPPNAELQAPQPLRPDQLHPPSAGQAPQPAVKLAFGRYKDIEEDLYLETYDGKQSAITLTRAQKEFPKLYEELYNHHKSFRRWVQSAQTKPAKKRKVARTAKSTHDPNFSYEVEPSDE